MEREGRRARSFAFARATSFVAAIATATVTGTVTAMVVAMALITVPLPAVAATSVDVTFTATTGAGTPGSNTISAAPGDRLTAIVRVYADSAGVSVYGLSLRFDEDLGDELTLVSANELLNPPFDFNLTQGCASTQESTGAQPGEVLFCEAGTFDSGPPPPTTVEIIEVVLQATANVASDGPDLEAGFFHAADGMSDNADKPVSPAFGDATVNLLPEPLIGPPISVVLIVALSRRRAARGAARLAL
jgi:hypothetical protein